MKRVAALLIGVLLGGGLISSPASALPHRPDPIVLNALKYSVFVARSAVTAQPRTFLSGRTGGTCAVHILVRAKGPYPIISQTIRSDEGSGRFEASWPGLVSLWTVKVSDCKPLAI